MKTIKSPLPPNGGEMILLLEDRETIRSLVRTTLEAGGYHVMDARHLADAAAICTDHPIVLLVLDRMTAELGGSEFARRILALRPSVKLMILSGPEEVINPNRGVWQGPAFYQKPFLPARLAEQVRLILDSE